MPQAPRPSRRTEPVYEITGAARGQDADIRARTQRYLFSMALRTLCVILAIVLHGWLRWVCAGGAVLLPYFAVIFANGARQKATALPTVLIRPQRQPLEARPADPDDRTPTTYSQ